MLFNYLPIGQIQNFVLVKIKQVENRREILIRLPFIAIFKTRKRLKILKINCLILKIENHFIYQLARKLNVYYCLLIE